jgi:hypothetical protein
MSKSTVEARHTLNGILASPTTGLLQTNMNIIIGYDQRDLKLTLINHFSDGKLVKHIPTRKINGFDATTIDYVSKNIMKNISGALVYQIHDALESIDDTFMLIIWKASLFKSPRFYTCLVKTDPGRAKWNDATLKDVYKSLHSELNGKDRVFWTLENGTGIKLITRLSSSKDHVLKIAVCKCRSNDETDCNQCGKSSYDDVSLRMCTKIKPAYPYVWDSQ